jgi:hypothetical protein
MSTAFVFALLIHWGLAVALLMQTIATILADTVRQKAAWRTAFNVGQQALSFGAAWAVLWVFHQDASPFAPFTVDGKKLVGLVIAGLFYFLVNNGLVSQALALRNRTTFRAEFFSNWGYQVAANGALLGSHRSSSSSWTGGPAWSRCCCCRSPLFMRPRPCR